jgi:hypothetical protein
VFFFIVTLLSIASGQGKIRGPRIGALDNALFPKKTPARLPTRERNIKVVTLPDCVDASPPM